MTNTKNSNNTDVLESIAGYYYQLLIACSELCKLINNKPNNPKDRVGIEKGSDVRIEQKVSGVASVETKFYKLENFTRKSYPIKHTIFNFHNSFKTKIKSDKYIFTTNVGIAASDSSFFIDNWPKDITKVSSDYITYIKDCVVIDSIEHEPYLTMFNKFKIRLNLLGLVVPKSKKEKSIYLKYLLEYLHRGGKYEKFASIMSDSDIKDFIVRLEFKFSGNGKVSEVKDLKESIIKNIKAYYASLNDEDCENVMYAIMYEIFNSSVSEEFISVAEVITLIEEYNKNRNEFGEKYSNSVALFKDIEMVFEEESQRFLTLLKGYEYLDQVRHAYIGILEKFYQFIQQNKDNNLDIFLQRYSLDRVANPMILTNLVSAISVLCVYGKIDPAILELEEYSGISNIILNDNDKYYFKSTLSSYLTTTESLIATFVSKTMSNISRFKGDETIVFSSNNLRAEDTPCKYHNDNLRSLVSNISSIKSSVRNQQFYSRLDYRCTRCIDVTTCPKDEKDLEIKVCKFYKEKCR